MPPDMAMHQPHTRVISLVPNHQPAIPRHLHHVSSNGVVERELAFHRVDVEGTRPDAKGEKVVAVEVDGMGQGEVVLDDPKDPLVGLGDVDEVCRSRPGAVVLEDVLEDGVVPLDVDGGVLDTPLKHLAPAVVGELQGDGEGSDRGAGKGGGGHGAGEDGREAGLAVAGGDTGSAAVRREGGGARALVADDGSREKITGSTAVVVGFESGIKPVVAHSLVGLDDDIVALAHGHEKGRAHDWIDWNKVVRNHGEVVAYERDNKGVVDTGIDEAEKMFLAGGESETVVRAPTACAKWMNVLASEEDIVAVRRRAIADQLGSQVKSISSFVIVVIDHVRAEVDVIVGRCRATHDQGSYNTITILVGIMAVIPRGAILGDVEIICLHGSRWDRTLGHSVGTILVTFAVLANTMPVNRRSGHESEINTTAIDGKYIVPVVLHIIVHIDNDIVTPISFNRGSRELVCQHVRKRHQTRVNDDNVLLMSIAGFLTPSGPSQFVTLVM